MKFKVEVFKHFLNQFKKLQKKFPNLIQDINYLKNIITENPNYGESLGSGFYKIRLKLSDKASGKSGGARIITYVYYKEEIIYLVALYDKSEIDSIPISELKKILNSNL